MRLMVRRQGELALLSLKLVRAEQIQIQRTVLKRAPAGVTPSPRPQRQAGEVAVPGSAGDHRASALLTPSGQGQRSGAAQQLLPALPAPSLSRRASRSLRPCPALPLLQPAPGHRGTPGTGSQVLLFPFGLLLSEIRAGLTIPAGSGAGPADPAQPWPGSAGPARQDRAPERLPLGHNGEKRLQDEF